MAKAIDIMSQPSVNPLLEQLAGKDKGRVFELSIEEINLGREEDNDIVLGDESVSRLHAKIERNADGVFVINDNQSKNGVFVNKVRVDSSPLRHGDIIQMGHFVFRFRVPKLNSIDVHDEYKEDGLNEGMSVKPKVENSAKRKRLIIWGTAIVVMGGAWYLSLQDGNNTKDETKQESKTDDKFQPSALPEYSEKANSLSSKGLEDPLNRTEKEISNLENQDNSVKEAELSFRKGQRDYFNKNYHHAIDNFDTAISLYAKHPLASYYKGLAIHDAEVEAQKNKEIGLKYFNSLQYSRAIYHFKMAIDNLSHVTPDNIAGKKMISECEKYIDFAQRKLKAVETTP
jgi:pSer/pThr/pTyr-binding forkhead associated (FHA) protein